MKPRSWLALAGATLALVGCSRSEAGIPVPAAGTPSSAESSFDNPRDLAAVAGDPCALLSPQQLDAISPGLETSTEATPWGQTECIWDNDELSFSVAPDTETGQGVDDTLRKPGFIPAEVPSGYPAARDDLDSDSTCGLFVGVNDSAQLIMTFFRNASQNPEHQVPCEFLESVAAMVIENIPPAS